MKKSLSLLSANLLFALSLLLVVFLGAWIQSWNLSWGLIATEVFLIGLPAVLFLRWSGVPVRDGLRLNPISPLTGALSVVLGISLYLFALLIEGIMAQLTGLQSVQIDPSLLPITGWDMLLYFVGFAIFAPLGEEILFRGAVQGAYEQKKSAWFAITITALMFAFYHLRLSGLPGLLPVAFALGYVAWRTRSIYAVMLIHFGNNATAALNDILYFNTGKGLPLISLWSALAGLALAAAILLWIRRLHPVPVTDISPPGTGTAAPGPSRHWLATYWPLVAAGVLYTSVAGLDVINSVASKPAPLSQVEYGSPSLGSPVKSIYQIENRGGQVVGEMVCMLSGATSTINLDCTRSIQAYEYKTGSSFFKDGTHTGTIHIAWDSRTMMRESFEMERRYDDGAVFRSTVRDGKIVSTDSGGAKEGEIGAGALLEMEWAWRAALLKANAGQAFEIPFGYLMTWDESTQEIKPLVKNEILRVFQNETLTLPGRDVTVRKMTLARYTAWFSIDDAIAGLPRPVKLDDGMVIYSLLP